MGSVERCDKTLPLNEMIYYVRKDAVLRDRWLNDLDALCREYGLSEEEIEALTAVDVRRMMEMGVHQYLIPHILRLFYGVTGMTNNHPALLAYQEAFPEETEHALTGTIWDREKENV